MQDNFSTALKYVLVDEGGNDDDPRDHGGRTSRGITQREYDSWCKLQGKPRGDVWYASDDDVATIYHDQYWNPYCDKLPSGLDYLFFDISVNAGRQRAVTTFQRVLEVNVDGMMGQVTLAAILNYPDKVELIHKVSDERRRWYKSLKQFSIFGRGWLNRVNHCERGAVAMAENNNYNRPTSVPSFPKTKDAEQDGPSLNPETAGSATGGLGTLTAVLEQLRQNLEPYQSLIKPVVYVTLALTLIGAGYTVWSFYKQRKLRDIA